MALLAAGQSLSAQDHRRGERRFWVDIQLAQHLGLNRWNSVGYANDALPAASITELRGVLNFNPHIFPWFKFFVDMGLGVTPAPTMKTFDLGRMPMPNSGTSYYLREMISESGSDKTSAHFRIAAGLFGEFRVADKLSVMPYAGIGGLTMSPRNYQMILKEDGTNMQYHATYRWGMNACDEYGPYNGDMLGFFTGRINCRYKIKPGTSLLLGLEYTYFFDAMDFHGRYSNTFNDNISRSFMSAGNKMNMLGISVGISFR